MEQEKIQQEKPIQREINTLSTSERSEMTKTPTKIQNPNRVTAGKRLAELNKKKKENLKKKTAVIVNPPPSVPTSECSDANMLFKGMGVVALGFVGYYIYKKFTPSRQPTQASLPSRDRQFELVSHREKEKI